jgi:hypothetical protein
MSEVTWRDYVDTRLTAIEASVALARINLEKRLDGMNEIREQLHDQADTFVTGVEHEALCARIDRMEAEIHGLRESRAELSGKASQSSVDNAKVMAMIGLLLAIVGIVLKFVG